MIHRTTNTYLLDILTLDLLADGMKTVFLCFLCWCQAFKVLFNGWGSLRTRRTTQCKSLSVNVGWGSYHFISSNYGNPWGIISALWQTLHTHAAALASVHLPSY